MRIIHLLPERVNHLTSNIVRFFAHNFENTGTNITDHLFIKFQEYSTLTKEEKDYYSLPNLSPDQLVFIPPTVFNLFKALYKVTQKDILIIHSGRIRWIWLVLFMMPKLWKRSVLTTWGAEIEVFERHSEATDFYERSMYLVERIILPRLRAICTLTEGEYKIIQSVFPNCDNYFRAITSSTPINGNYTPKSPIRENHRHIKVLLNQSANYAGRHLEALDWLSKFRESDMSITCPLSYGPKDEASKIIQYGKYIFGDRFQAFTELLPYNGYRRLLDDIDILVFNHLTQNGLGNLYIFLSKGKVVYIRNEATTFEMLKNLEIEVRETKSIPGLTFEEFAEPLSEEASAMNIRQFNKYLSSEAAAMTWGDLFRSIRVENGR